MNTSKTLTGYLRFKMAKEWLRRGKPGEYEDFVKAACKAMSITYTPPNKK